MIHPARQVTLERKLTSQEDTLWHRRIIYSKRSFTTSFRHRRRGNCHSARAKMVVGEKGSNATVYVLLIIHPLWQIHPHGKFSATIRFVFDEREVLSHPLARRVEILEMNSYCVFKCSGLRHPAGGRALLRGLFGLMDPPGVSGLLGVVSPELSTF